MNDYSKEMDAFFAPLVGSKAAIIDLQEDLSERIAPHVEAPDAFLRLEAAANRVIQLTITDANKPPPDSTSSTLSKEWRSIGANAPLGVQAAIGALITTSDIYARRARVPQATDRVKQNTDKALRYVYGNAFNDGYTAIYNGLGMRTGRNPANRFNKPFFLINFLYRGAEYAIPHRRAFRVATDKDGQLDIRPRHRLINSKSEERCPATDARIGVAHESPSALLSFMRAISSVAVRDIYPHRFSMI